MIKRKGLFFYFSILISTPVFFIVLNFVSLLLTLLTYEMNYSVKINICFIVVFFGCFFLFVYSVVQYSNFDFFPKYSNIDSNFQYPIFFIVIIINICEYFYFTPPLLSILKVANTSSIYVEYGFPLLHHIAVTSWIVVFFKSRFNILNIIYKIFSFLNPLFIVNRDLILLTFFCYIIQLIINNKKEKIFIFIVIALILFSSIGNLRSGDVFEYKILPIKEDAYNNIDKRWLWIFIYLTSSWYNFIYNFVNKQSILYAENINVFPESYRFYVSMGIIGLLLFYILIFFIICVYNKLANRKDIFPLYIYILYESAMTIFARKVFTTNTLFITVFIFGLFFIKQSKYYLFKCSKR